MSSFATQLILGLAGDWPEAARPNAGCLVAHSPDLMGVVGGKLAGALGVPKALADAGWATEDLEAWRGALSPAPAPATPADKIISIAGRYDGVTPFGDAVTLLDAWGVPAANRFAWRHGHMTLPSRLGIDRRPLTAYLEKLAS